MAVSRTLLRNLTEQLAAITNTPIDLQIWSPGDGRTRYQLLTVYTDSNGRQGLTDSVFGSRVYSAGELEIFLRAALQTAWLLVPNDARDRSNAYWTAKNGGKS